MNVESWKKGTSALRMDTRRAAVAASLPFVIWLPLAALRFFGEGTAPEFVAHVLDLCLGLVAGFPIYLLIAASARRSRWVLPAAVLGPPIWFELLWLFPFFSAEAHYGALYFASGPFGLLGALIGLTVFWLGRTSPRSGGNDSPHRDGSRDPALLDRVADS